MYQFIRLFRILLLLVNVFVVSCTLTARIESLNSFIQEQPKTNPPFIKIISFTASQNSTTQFSIDLNISAENAIEMLISNNANCIPSSTTWEPYQTTKSQWPLTIIGGTNYIYLKVRNENKLESDCVNIQVNQVINTNPISEIILDEADNSITSSPIVNFKYSNIGNTFNLSDFEFSVGSTIGTTNIKNWTSLGIIYSFQVNGLILTLNNNYYINLRAKNTNGNYSSITSKSWRVVSSANVIARYASAPNWNDYVKKSAPTTSCAATDTNYYACLHGGEKKEVSIIGENSCTGIEAYDSLSVFTWTCQSGSPIKMITKEVKTGKGLKDLVNETSWKNNKVIIKKSGTPIAASSLGIWWSNTVLPLPDNSFTAQTNLSTASAIYTLSTTRTTKGYSIDADKIAIVTLNNHQLIADPSATSNSTTSGTPGSDLYSMFITTKKHFWIEGHFVGTFYDNNSLHYFLIDNGSAINIINNSVIEGFYYGIYNGFQKSVIKSIRSLKNRIFHYSGTSSNIHVRDSIFQEELNSFSQPSGSSNIIITNNYFSGGSFSASKIDFSSATNLTISFNTTSTSINFGFGVGVDIHNILTPNTSDWLYLSLTNKTTVSNFISNFLNVINSNSTNLKFSGLVSYNTLCSASDSIGITTSCALIAPSNGSLISGIDVLHSSTSGKTLVGFASSDSNHPNYTISGMSYNEINNWTQFDRPTRLWVNSTKSRCIPNEICYIYDYALAQSDLIILNKSGNLITVNSIFPTDSSLSCPSEVNGNQIITDLRTTPQNYLKTAFEIIGDEIGDDDSLCESSEACVYAPNIGAYQGHGDYTTRTCMFQNGTVSGVTMYAYPYNGHSN